MVSGSAVGYFEAGAPQGTILDPVLFIIYINSLFNQICGSTLVTYADDTALYVEENTWGEVITKTESCLTILKSWFDYKLMKINESKTKFITFTAGKISRPSIQTLKIHKYSCSNNVSCSCNSIEAVLYVKYLGLYIDKHLRCDKHVEKLANKLLCHSISFVMYLYFAVVQSLTHCWHGAALLGLGYIFGN